MKRILYRDAVKDDWPAIVQLHREQQEKQGTDFELPWLWGKTIALALVGAEDSGKIRNCIYVESVAELRFVGCDPRATAFGRREADGIAYVLKLLGFRYWECFVPRQLKKAISKPLLRAGFEDKEPELAYFSRDLRGGKL